MIPASTISQIRNLAAQGYTPKGIGEQLNISDAAVRRYAHIHEIEIRHYENRGKWKRKPKPNLLKGHSSELAKLPTEDEIKVRVMALAESVGAQNSVKVRKATPEELAELAYIKPLSNQNLWYEKWSDV